MTLGTVSSAEVDSVAMTQESVITELYAINTTSRYIYSLTGISSGTVTLDFAFSTTCLINIIFTDNTSTTSPITVLNTLNGITDTVITQGTQSDTSLLLSLLFVDNAIGELSSTPTLTTYDEGTQTNSNGYGIALKSDGTKMYVSGGTGAGTSIFQYTLGTAWQISSGVTYDGVSLNINTQFPSTQMSSIKFNPTGTKMFLSPMGAASTSYVTKTWDLGTAWDLSTAVYNAAEDSPNADNGGATTIYGIAMTSDGTDYYLSGSEYGTYSSIFRYTMSTPFDFSTATYVNKVRLNEVVTSASTPAGACMLNYNDTVLYVTPYANKDDIVAVNFNPHFV